MPDYTLEETIQNCCHNKTLLEVYYEKKDGNRGRYILEPYEVRYGKLWGFDVNEGKIKQFIMSRIANYGDLKQSWSVEEGHKREEWERKEAVELPEKVKLVKRD